jgi:hypothetical protein
MSDVKAGDRVRVLPATTAGQAERGSVVSVTVPFPEFPRNRQVTVAFDDGTRCTVPSFRVEHDEA